MIEDKGRAAELLNATMPGTDFSTFLAEPLHVALIEGKSAAVFAWRGPGIYEVHVHFEVRGRAAIDLLHRMIEAMRFAHDALLFWALIPQEDRKTRMFARLCGWKSLGMKRDSFGPKELFVSEICPCLSPQS
ncbi:MAG: hypothetical protein V4527_18405 [Pseudomonadota bacterium]